MKSLKRNSAKKEVPKISLWGIDKETNFNALHYDQEVPENLPQYSPHKKNHFVAIFVLKGTLTSFVDFKEYELNPGTSGIINPNQINWIEVKRPQRIEAYIIAFNKDFLNKLDVPPRTKIILNAPEVHIKIEKGEHEEILRTLFKSIVEEFKQQQQTANAIVRKLMEALLIKFTQLFPGIKAELKRTTPVYLQFLNALDNHITDSHRVSYYAELLKISEKSINRACNAVVGQSAQEVIHHKINYEAKRLLHFSKNSAKEISFKTGFTDPIQFSKFFKQKNRYTPLEYRRQLFAGK